MPSLGTRESERSEAPFLRLYCAGPAFPMGPGRPGYEELVRDSRAACALRCVHSVATDGNACGWHA
eukprot:scaffold58465_cov75-Phaeocystis_antarctica.AAC.1